MKNLLNLSLFLTLFLISCGEKKKTEEELRAENIKKAEDVSKEILNTFITKDNKIENQNADISNRNNLIMGEIETAKPYLKTSQRVHKLSLSSSNNIIFLANELLKYPLNDDKDWIEVDETGFFFNS